MEHYSEHLDEVTSAVEALTATFDHADDPGVLLQAACRHAVQVIPGADMASMTILRNGTADTAASTDQRAVAIDQAQYLAGDGPCLHAARSGKIVRVSVDTAEQLWPVFTTTARDLGVLSYLAAPLAVDADLSGAMNLFGFDDHGFRELDAQLLDLYTSVVHATLRSTRRYLRARTTISQLENALTTRGVIEQAKGILMAAHRVTADEAFRLLVAKSQSENTKLHDVAAQFVTHASAPR
jgi:hypothetical protein